MNTSDPYAYLKRAGLAGGSERTSVSVKRHSRAMPSPSVSDRAHEHTVPHRPAASAGGYGQSATRGTRSAPPAGLGYDQPGFTGRKAAGHQGQSYSDKTRLRAGQGQAGTRSINKLAGVVPSGTLGGRSGAGATAAGYEHATGHRSAAPRHAAMGGKTYNAPGQTGGKANAQQGKTKGSSGRIKTGKPTGYLGHFSGKQVLQEGHNDAKTFAGKSMKPGGGGRFAKMVSGLEQSGKSPERAQGIAVAAGRAKYGKAKFQQMATAGRKRAMGS